MNQTIFLLNSDQNRTVFQFASVELIRRFRARTYQLIRVRLALVALDIARSLLLSLLSSSRRNALHALYKSDFVSLIKSETLLIIYLITIEIFVIMN